MSLKALGKLFMSIGIVLLVYGLAMDTSVSTGYGRVVNIGLANDRLMFILIGGFIFVGGVIFFGIFKAKQSKDDELAEKHERDARTAESRAKVKRVGWILSNTVAKDKIVRRLAHGLIVGFLVTGLADFIRPPTELIFLGYLVSTSLGLRAVEYRIAAYQCWIFCAILMVYLSVHTLVVGKLYVWILIVPVAIVSILVFRWYRKNED